MTNLQEALKELPEKPGVYLMKDRLDHIIYVGKAVKLSNRVRQYFQSSRKQTAKIQKMVSQIHHFEYIVTDSELEALVLECNLIKEHRPKYNTMLKDDKGYPYIKVTVDEDFPRVVFARQRKRDHAKYFGPYTSAGAVKDTIELIQKLYCVRTCRRKMDQKTGRPCLNYDMKQCKAPCQGWVSKEEYQASIQQVIGFLNGQYAQVQKQLEQKMQEASEQMQFEEAARYRDLLRSVLQIAQKQKIESSREEDRDVVAFARAADEAVIQVFFIRSGRFIGRDHFYLTGVAEDSRAEILTNFVKQFYSGTPFVPKELVLQETIEEESVIAEWLSQKKGQKVWIRVPKKGEKEKLVELAEKNASLLLQKEAERMKQEQKRTIGAMQQLAESLQLSSLKRIESYDISNLNGFFGVGSMVVFENGKPRRNDYRKFRIQWTKGPNDYASLYEVLTRRFLHGQKEREVLQQTGTDLQYGSFTRFPDLIFMDGGKGQVNVAKQVMQELGIEIPVCGMVKDDHHRTRGLYYQNQEIPIEKHSEQFALITRIQDETHRFAIEYHRLVRKKAQVHSVLDQIKGIGSVRKKALLKHFHTLEAIKHATKEELQQISSMNESAVENVYQFFHNREKQEGGDKV